MKKLGWLVLPMLLIFGSCGDDVPEKEKFENGVIVVNQGAFQTGTGTLTYKERGSSKVVQDIFSLNNEGAFLGNIAQSMIEHEGKNYISINNGGKIVVTDKDDFTLIDTIGSIYQSRYFASDGENLYVGAWGQTGIAGNINEIDTENHRTLTGTVFGSGVPEGMIFVDDLLYVAKNGGFGLDSLLLILDIMDDNNNIQPIVVGHNPELVVKDNDNNVYVICNGNTDYLDPTNNTAGRLVKISNQEIEWSFEIPNGSNRLAIDAANGYLYFNMNGNVVKQSIDSNSLSTKVVREGTAYALGFDAEDRKLYIGDAKDFASQGDVYIYSTEDVELETFKCGIIPSYFHFK